MTAAVPVNWLDEISDQAPSMGSLAPGTMLDGEPSAVSDVHSHMKVSWATIRVNGRSGIVRTDRLSEALGANDNPSAKVA